MRANLKLLLIYVAIGVIAAGTTAYFLHQNRKGLWCECARSTFAEALREELQKREVKNIPYFTWGVRNSSARKDSLKSNSFKEVLMRNKDGEKTYLVPAFKFEHNIEDDCGIRMLQSYILEKHPLVVDSLNFGWTKTLQKMGFAGKNLVRVSVIDLLEQETKCYSNDPSIVNKADSLLSFYVGYRSEVEITGFLDLPWWKNFYLKDIVLLCGLMIICSLLPFLFGYINRLYRSHFVKTEIVTIEKQVPVFVTEKSGVHIYQLDPEVLFDYGSLKLCRNDQMEPLTPQLADLLKLFLEADDYLLTTAKMAEVLWPNSIDAKNNIYSAIKKLREILSRISLCTIDTKKAAYQLKIPHFIEKDG